MLASIQPARDGGAAKAKKEDTAYDGNRRDDHEIAILPFKLRHILEVHAVDTGDCRGHREDGAPGRKPPRDIRLLALPGHQARLEGEGQHFAERVEDIIRAI